MKTIIDIPDLTNEISMISFMGKLYPEQKPYLNKFNFEDLKTSVKQVLIHFNSIHSGDFELNPPTIKRDHQIDILFDYKLSKKVIKYIRKNPKQVYKNYKSKKSIFGPYSHSIKIVDIDKLMKEWKGLYHQNQLKMYMF